MKLHIFSLVHTHTNLLRTHIILDWCDDTTTLLFPATLEAYMHILRASAEMAMPYMTEDEFDEFLKSEWFPKNNVYSAISACYTLRTGPYFKADRGPYALVLNDRYHHRFQLEHWLDSPVTEHKAELMDAAYTFAKDLADLKRYLR